MSFSACAAELTRRYLAQPLGGVREAHLLPRARREADVAREGGRLQERAPALAQLVAELRRRQPPHVRGELLARERAAVERAGDRGEDCVGALGGQAERLQPAAARRPRRQHALRRHEQRQLGGGQQVQRAAHRPRLDERPLLPQRALHGVGLETVDPRPQRQLRGRHDLRVEADDPVDDVEHRLTRGAPVELLAAQPPRQDAGPLESGHRSLLEARLRSRYARARARSPQRAVEHQRRRPGRESW